MLESHGASFRMPDGLPELMLTLEETWPGHLAEIRASGVPTNETPEEPPAEPAALEAGVGAGAATTGGEDPEEPAAAEPAEAQPQYDPLELESMQQRLAAFEEREQQLLAALQDRGGAPEAAPVAGGFTEADYDDFGNLRPEALRREMTLAAQEANRPLLEAIAQARQQEHVAQVQEHYGELVEDMIANEVARNGDLSENALLMVDARAMQILPELNQRYGTNPDGTARPGVVERAIEQAASEVRGLLGEHAGSELEQERNRLATLASQHGEPGPGGGGAHEASVVKIGERVTDRYAAAGQ